MSSGAIEEVELVLLGVPVEFGLSDAWELLERGLLGKLKRLLKFIPEMVDILIPLFTDYIVRILKNL